MGHIAVAVPHSAPAHAPARHRVIGSTVLLMVTRSPTRLTSNDFGASEMMHIAFLLNGSGDIRRVGDAAVPLDGDSVVTVVNWNRVVTQCARGTRSLHVILPLARLTARGVRPNPNRLVLEGASSLRTPLRNFALSLTDDSWRTNPVAEQVAERTLEDLIVGMFLEVQATSLDADELRAGLRVRALDFIARHHGDASLNPGAVADALHVSLRHLQRSFSSADTTIAETIAERRTESAALLLAAPGAKNLTIAQIASRAGFSSPFELRTAFRARFGQLPSVFRDLKVSALDAHREDHSGNFVPGRA